MAKRQCKWLELRFVLCCFKFKYAEVGSECVGRRVASCIVEYQTSQLALPSVGE